MAAPLTPTGIKVQGKVKVVFAPTGSLTSPSLAIATGATALDVSNIFYADGWSYTKETSKVTAPRRLGTTRQWEQAGTTSETLGELHYQVDPQAAAATDGKKAWEKLPNGTTGFFYVRKGLDVNTDLAIGQFVEVVPTQLLERYITGDPTDEAAEFTVVQQAIITAPGAGDLVALVA